MQHTLATLIHDAETGDILLPIPATLGWLEGDTVKFAVVGETVMITNVSLEAGRAVTERVHE
jgi:hypothetical protein